MDLIYGAFSLSKKIISAPVESFTKVLNPTSFLSRGSFYIGLKRNICTKKQDTFIFNDESNKISTALTGQITNRKQLCQEEGLDDITDTILIAQLYKKYGIDATAKLNGLFSAVLFDSAKQKIYIFQDPCASTQYFYWIVAEDVLYFSTSLKILINIGKFKRKVNDRGLLNLLVNGVIFNKETLLGDVSKLIPGEYLTSTNTGIKIETLPEKRRFIEIKNTEEAKKSYYVIFDKIMRDLILIEESNRLGIALSAGYDTNFNLACLKKIYPQDIIAISVGCDDVRDESHIAAQIATSYPSEFHKAIHNNQTILNLPEIVWILEGAVYESGIFLCYLLSKTAKSLGINKLICGEGANQILSKNRLLSASSLKYRMLSKSYNLYKTSLFIRKVYDHPFFRKLTNNRLTEHWYPLDASCYLKKHYDVERKSYLLSPYQLTTNLILKKSGLMHSAFSLSPVYPYYDERFVQLAAFLYKINKTKKLHHNQMAKNVVPHKVKTLLKVQAGKTPIEINLSNQDIRKKIFKYLKDSKTLANYINMDIIRNWMDTYDGNFLIANQLIGILYFSIWHEIFIDGRFDSEMSGENFNYSLMDFI